MGKVTVQVLDNEKTKINPVLGKKNQNQNKNPSTVRNHGPPVCTNMHAVT